MTKLDLVLARLSRLPPDRQEAVAVQLEWLIDDEESGEALLTDEQWAEVKRRIAEEDGTLIQIIQKYLLEFRNKN